MVQKINSCVVLIPSLNPPQSFEVYVGELVEKGFQHIVIIDDGSNEDYQAIFQRIQRRTECEILRHRVNQGKGAALKKGMEYVKEHYKGCSVITVDCDGQHDANDVLEIVRKATEDSCKVILGSRKFQLFKMPLRSWVGNRMTTLVFGILNLTWIKDTQTGLRFIDRTLFGEMLKIPGERFEYETNVLIYCSEQRIKMDTIPIRTIYENNNEQSQFRGVTDSVRIAKNLCNCFVRFLVSSGLSSLIDLSLAWVLFQYFASYFDKQHFALVFGSVLIARMVSLTFNYVVNKKYVFQKEDTKRNCWVPYVGLCIFNIVVSSTIIYLVCNLMSIDEIWVKGIVDIGLFFVNYHIQKRYIFKDKRGNE